MTLFERVVERVSMRDMTALEATIRYAITKASLIGQDDNEQLKQVADELIAATRDTMMEAGLSNALSDEKPVARKNKRHSIPRD